TIMEKQPVRWGIIGTANIARGAFLPGLRAAGGVAAAVAGRELGRAQQWASEHGVEQGVAGYQTVIDDPSIDALYIPLPNSLHAEWTIKALQAGKPVLCEKPLCGSLAEVDSVLAVARETGTLLWEAFVFPFHDQFAQVRKLLADGAIGELREIQSNFGFPVSRPENIRLSADLDGGALNDVGCYPVRLALELFGAGHTGAWAAANWGGRGVDVEMVGSLGFPGGQRLLLSSSMRRSFDTFSRLLGTGGQIQLTNPFHPRAGDHFEVLTDGEPARTIDAGATEPSFTNAIRHVQAVLRGEQAPRQLALDTSLASAQALHDLHESMGSSPG
ncbi:MAG: Gfo/Idh/MocA family oxidoreductase, partial [Actinomycetota bacterium]